VSTSTRPSATTAAAATAERVPAQPKSIGRYEVERLLGQGGMGRVWLARDTVLGRRVAIKVLRDDLALPPTVRDELIVRMGHEARAAAAVSHPNIVTLYDMGEDVTLGLFLVFEYVTTKRDEIGGSEVAGPDADADLPVSLRDRVKKGPIGFAEVAKLARELGTALSFAHEAGVIHRDVKPENILFSRTGAKIADFGIARIPDSTITRANTVLGTPAYTAPEALSKGDFGPASDQFSLAATLYEAATGARAFSGDDAIVTAGKVSSEPPPPLHESIGPEPVVRALDAALQRGLAKTPEARFASCSDLGTEVARAIETEGVVKRPTASARGGSGSLTPIPGILELERTPLSSRVAIVQRAISEHPSSSGSGETPRPSIYLRKRAHRFQNIAAGIALIVILVLVLLGRRTPPTPNPEPTTPAASPSVNSASSTGGATLATQTARPHAKTKPSASSSSSAARSNGNANSNPVTDAGTTAPVEGDD
jgi:serine/threonine protein kinase